MQNTNLYIYGSEIFYKIISDLDLFNKVYLEKNFTLNSNSIVIAFVDGLSSQFLSSLYKLNLPVIYISNNMELKKKINLSNFSVFLKVPIEIQNFIEISKILISKFDYLKASQVFIKDYSLNSNDRSIKKKNQKLKLTEIEVKLILFMNVSKGFSKDEILENVWNQKAELDTHTFETCLYRLRKKMKDKFNDNNFIYLKNEKYYLL